MAIRKGPHAVVLGPGATMAVWTSQQQGLDALDFYALPKIYVIAGPAFGSVLRPQKRPVSTAVAMVLHSLASSFEAATKGDTSFIVCGGTCGCSRSLAVSRTRKAARIVISNRNLTKACWQKSPPDN